MNNDIIKKIDALITNIKESSEYKNYVSLTNKISNNEDINTLVNEIKKIEKDLVRRPSILKEEELKQMMETLEVGDSVLTTSGFYGVVVDKVDETTIIVEFGNDKHCRIPMEKSAIQAMEKANASSSEE